jgi:hypothetical protein
VGAEADRAAAGLLDLHEIDEGTIGPQGVVAGLDDQVDLLGRQSESSRHLIELRRPRRIEAIEAYGADVKLHVAAIQPGASPYLRRSAAESAQRH